MKMIRFLKFLPALLVFTALGFSAQTDEEARLLKQAEKIHDRVISIDTHTDTALELVRENVDLSKVQADFAKLREGRVDCCFYPIFVDQGPLDDASRDSAYLWARGKMEAIRAYIQARPKEASIALTAADIVKNKKRRRLSLVMGLENGYPIGRDLGRLKDFYDLGARIITLSHNYDNDICDASRYPENTWGGLSPFGKQLVREMNRLGIIVDCSHASTSTLYDCLELSTAPVICSHSCVYAIKDHPRNLTDDEIRAIAAKGGVVQVTTGRWALSWLPRSEVDISTFCDHVEYIRRLVGIEHVGIGTDFDGGGGMKQLEDASKMKYITVELLRRGWTAGELELFWGGNLLRVMRAVENAAQK
ncbi:MAG: dipeptidase [Bacteroidales bacterium]|nr:dipeptidase [Bacteroidales bacterium]